MTTPANLEDTGSSPHIYRAAGRAAGKTLRRNRVVNASIHGLGQGFRALVRILRALFLETMGLFFLLFSLAGGIATYRSYDGVISQKVWFGAAFSLLFLYFGVSSFWRARERKH